MCAAKEKKSKINRVAKLLLKCIITAVCIAYVANKIDFKEAANIIKSANLWMLGPAFLIFVCSKLIAALRIDLYFKNIHIYLKFWENIKLYWMGMFYNLFLPGSISGDAYKVVVLRRRYNISLKKTAAAVLLDRITGLLALMIILAVYGLFVIKAQWLRWSFIATALMAVPAAYIIIKFFFNDFIQSFWPTFFLGGIMQLMTLGCVYLILCSMGVGRGEESSTYVFIFLVAAIASVLPITVGGGLGIREFVIMEGARLAMVDAHIAVGLSLLFYFITLLCSAAGIVFVYKNPLK